MRQFIAELYPICRSITQEGVRATLSRIQREVLLVINIIRLGLGSTAVAGCTQYLFRRDDAVNLSLLVVHIVALSLAAVLLGSGLKPFLRSLDRLNKWTADQR
jgi:hypothetical protein